MRIFVAPRGTIYKISALHGQKSVFLGHPIMVILKIFALAAFVQKFVRMTSDFKKLFTGPGKNYIISNVSLLRASAKREASFY